MSTFLERSYGTDESTNAPPESKTTAKNVKIVESRLHPAVQKLMQLIFNRVYFAQALAEMDYDAARLPLKDLSNSVLRRAFETLVSALTKQKLLETPRSSV